MKRAALALLIAAAACGREAEPRGEPPAPPLSADSVKAIARHLEPLQRELFAAIAAGDSARLATLLADDFVFYGPEPHMVNAPDLSGAATPLPDALRRDVLGGSLAGMFDGVTGPFTVRNVQPAYAEVLSGTQRGGPVRTEWRVDGSTWRAAVIAM